MQEIVDQGIDDDEARPDSNQPGLVAPAPISNDASAIAMTLSEIP